MPLTVNTRLKVREGRPMGGPFVVIWKKTIMSFLSGEHYILYSN